MAQFAPHDEPKYVISIAARLVNLHPQTLRHSESLGLVRPKRTKGNRRLYSEQDLERIRLITRLMNELGVTLAGVEVILNMTEQMQALRAEMAERERELLAEIARLRQALARATRGHVMPFSPPLPADTDGAGGEQWWSERT